jgi:hypothetical protein
MKTALDVAECMKRWCDLDTAFTPGTEIHYQLGYGVADFATTSTVCGKRFRIYAEEVDE